MKKRDKPQFLLLIYADKETVKKAVGKPSFIGAYRNTQKALDAIDAIGTEFDPPEWSDYEDDTPETKMGY